MSKNTFLVLLFFIATSAQAWSKPDFLKEKYLEVEVIEAPQDVIDFGATPTIKGYLCLKNNIGHSNACHMLAPEDLAKYDLKFTYPYVTSDISSNVQIIEEDNRYRFEVTLPPLASTTQSPRFGAYLFQKGQGKFGLQVAYQKILVHIERLEQLQDKIKFGKNSYLKHLNHLKSIAKKLQKKIHATEARWAERSLPLQLKNFVAAPSSWMVSTSSWNIEATAQLGTGFRGEKSWLDLTFDPYNDEDDEWKVEVRQDNQLIFERENFKANLNQRVQLAGNFVGSSDVEVKIWGKNSKKSKFSWDPVFKRELGLVRIEDEVAPSFRSFIPSPGRYVGRDVPTFSLVLEDLKGRMDRTSVDGDLVEDGGSRVSLKNAFSFETSQSTLVEEIHGGQNGSDLFSITGVPQGVPEGFYNLQMLVKDFAGNQAPEAQWRFIVDRTSPIIALPMVPSVKSNDESYEVSISVTDATDVIVQVFHNGAFVGETNQKEDGIAVDLVDGPNFVRITAVDEAGNMSEVNYPPIFLDFTAPEIENINLESGQLIRTASYNIQGSSYEDLAAVLVNGEEIDFEGGSSFSIPLNLYTEGEQTISVELIDLAGNTNTFEYTIDFLLRLVDGALIRVEKINADQMKIIGFPGATGPNFPIEIDGGWFNSSELTANADGSFEATLDSFEEAVVTATYPVNGREESVLAKFKFDTTLAGVIRDKDDNPLPGVSVTIRSSGQTTTTDTAGRFYIPDPALGDQTLLVDGTTIPQEVTQGTKEFAQISYNVSLGSRQQNILERPIFLSPKLLDGSETVIASGAGVTVSSPHAPGVSLEIAAGSAVFPGGGNSGSVNIIEIPGSKTSVELPDEVIPATVYALEPSGLEFKQRAHLTLPNPNDFPEGTELVIVSKNSETGYWELDGSATVTGPDTIETKPGQGISHFSEIFVSPFGMEMKKFADGDKPRIDSLDGGVSTQVTLPSFKILGQDIAPTLTYNSNWAYPNALVTNVFELPRQYFDVREKDSITNWGVVSSDVRIQTWVTPEWIDAEFAAGNVQSGKMRYTGLPDKSVVSSQHDLSSLPSGIIPTKASYEIKFKQLTLVTGKAKVRGDTGTQTIKLKPQTTVLWESVFPPDLQAPIYLQNKRNSSYGEGWKLNLTKNILNPQNDRILVENENGGLAVYAIKNDVQNLAYDASGIEALGTDGNDVYWVSGANKLSKYSNGSTSEVGDLPRNIGTVGINASWYQGYSRKCVKSGWNGCRKYEYTYRYYCEKYNAPFNTGKTAKSLSIQNGQVYLLDELGAVYEASNQNPLAGAIGLPPIFTSATNATSGPSIVSHCTNSTGESCLNEKQNDNLYIVSVKGGKTNSTGYCNTATCYSGNCSPRTWLTGSGTVPQVGFADGPLSIAKFNKPFDFAPGNREGTYYVADYGNNIVRFVDLTVGNVSTVAGNKSTYDNGNGGFATAASMYHPRGIAVDTDGSFFVSTEKGYIRKVTPDGRINAFAGKPTTAGGVLSDLTTFEQLALSNPSGMVIDKEKDILYVADTGHHRILRLDLNRNLAKVVAGNGTCVPGDTVAGKVALEISFCSPEKIALDANGNLLVLDQVNKRVRRINFTSPNDGLLQYKPLAKDNSMLYRNASGEFNLTYRDGSQTIFNSDGLQVETSDRTGRIHQFTYNDDKQLTVVRFPTGQELSLDYSGDRLSQITDPAGRTTQFSNDGGRLETVVYPDNSQRQFTYQEDGILLEEKDQLGYSTTYELNNLKRLKAIHRPDNTVVQLNDALSQTVHHGQEGESEELKSFQSDQNKLQDIIKDAKGIETAFSRDTNGYVDTITDAEGKVTKVERDSEGRPTKITRHDNTYVTMTYNSTFGDLILKYDSSSDSSEAYQYDQWGHLTLYTNPLGQTRSDVFDAQSGLLLEEYDFLGQVTKRSYGNLGLIASVTSPSNEISRLVYNQQGNVVQLISPSSETTNIVRDEAGNVISKTNSKGEVTVNEYDVMNRLLAVKTPKNLITRYSYSNAGELIGILDPEGNQTSFQYDSLRRVTRKISPLGQVWQMNYDPNGNVIQEIDPKGQIKSYIYDMKNRVVRKTFPDDILQMTYDDRGNLLTLSNYSSSFTMTYTEIAGEDRMSSVVSSGTGMPGFTAQHVFNSLGNRIELNTNFGSWFKVYDAENRITSVSGPSGVNYTFGFDASSRLSNIVRPGTSTNFSFDASSFVTQILHKQGNTNVSTFAYQLDPVGNRTRILSSLGNTVLNYDNEGQLVSASLPELQEIFAYDNLGNRISDNNGNFSYDEKKYRLTEDYTYIYAWDANGNMITKQEKGLNGLVYNYAYTANNQLKQVQLYEGSSLKKEVLMVYDALGRRIKKQVIDQVDDTKSFVRKFLYDGDEIIGVFDEDDTLLARYIHSGMRTDDVLGVEITDAGASAGLAQSSGKYQFLKDALGSITDITDASGNVIQRYSYSSYGKILKVLDSSGAEIQTPSLKTHFAFTNREWEEELGVYYYRARYYDAGMGRFLQEDPDSGWDKNPATHNNKYIYVINNPFNLKDPTGRYWWAIPLAIGLVNAVSSYMEASNVKGASGSQIWGSTLLGFGTGFASAAYPGGWIASSLAVAGFSFIQNAGNQLIYNRGTNNYNFASAFAAAGYSGLANAATFGLSRALDANFVRGSGILATSLFGGPGDASPSGIPKECGKFDIYNYNYTYIENQGTQNERTYYYCN